MRRTWLPWLSLALALPLAVALPAAAQIAPHPDKLRFQPFSFVPPHARDHRVVLPASRVPAYLAEDRELPLINIQVLVRTGDYMEPPGMEGLAGLTGFLMARGGIDGPQPLDAQALEERLAYLAANLNTGIGDTQGGVSLNLLAKDLDEGLRLLKGVLSAPHFDEGRLQLRKDQALSEMRQRNDDAADVEARERRVLAFGEDHFTNRLPTQASITRIKRADLLAFHRRVFHPANFIVAAAGDFSQVGGTAGMAKRLDALFSAWPYAGEAQRAEIPRPRSGPRPGIYLVHKEDVTQGRVSILLPGIGRDDPDYYAIQVMNQVLGGGGFISRITNRVRSDEGLAYSAGSRFNGGIYYPDVFVAAFQSKLRSCAYATSIVLTELRQMREVAPTKDELTGAKKLLVESVPQRFRTRAAAMDVLAGEEFTGRYQKDPDYYARFAARVDAVTEKDVLRVAQKWLLPEQVAILLVGKKDALLNPDPKHPVRFVDLVAGQKLTELPARDPMTLKPLPLAAPTRQQP